MEANKFIEKKFFNRHFFLEAINESKHPIDFIADLMEEWEQLRIHGVVGQSVQLKNAEQDAYEKGWEEGAKYGYSAAHEGR